MLAKEKNKPQGKEERILHVIKTAKSLFIKQGYSGTTTIQIAREAGIAELTLFRYFPTKRLLFEAVIEPLINFEEFACDLLTEESFQCTNLFNLIDKRVRFVQTERELVRFVVVEAQFQPDLAGEFNPVANVEKQLCGLLNRKGLTYNTCRLIVQVIKGLLLSIVFTPELPEQIIATMVKMTESQILNLVQEDKQNR